MADKKKLNLKEHLTIKNIFVSVIGAIFILNLIQINMALGNFDYLESRDRSLISEVGDLKNTYMELGEDINQIKDFLRLPTKSYQLTENTDEETDSSKNTDEIQLAMFKYIGQLAEENSKIELRNKSQQFLDELQTSESFNKFLTDGGLNIQPEKASFYIKDESSLTLLKVLIDDNDAELYRENIDGKELLTEKDPKALEDSLTKYLQTNKKRIQDHTAEVTILKQQLADLIAAPSTQALTQELKISLNETGIILNASEEAIGEIVIDEVALNTNLIDLVNSKNSKKTSDLSKSFEPFLRSLDTKTLIEKKVASAQESIEKTLNDKGFKLVLEENNLKINKRDESGRLYYDITTQSDQVLSSIVLEKATGVVNITEPDGTNAQNILFLEEVKKKTLEADLPAYIPEYGENIDDDRSFNILIAGKHGSLVDTMIFTHIDEVSQEIKMISIPRDLFYNGRKINAYAHYYGMPELKRVLSDLTGYELDKYVLMDMYAFIDVIDLIGGIDVTLDKPVVDPFYRTVDKGVEGTLNYPPGDYHFSGVEALRIARSRKTSSDFARAERQQKILEGIQKKAKNFGLGDADTLYAIAKSVLQKVETDVTFNEAIAYYFRYQNYKIVSNDVMSSGNVLYVPPYITKENCNAQIAAAQANGTSAPDCHNQNQAYTLLPRDNNWNVIKWYFRDKFEEA